MRILISNDDGYRAPGLRALATSLGEIAEITVVAPERNRSGASNSLTLEHPLRMTELEPGWYVVDGTPADCVHLALTELFDVRPELVIAGINSGENLGEDVLYSGTVAAAMEGCLLGCAALAVSLAIRDCNNYAAAAVFVRMLVERYSQRPLPAGWLLNINVPDQAGQTLCGTQVTRLGQRHKDATTLAQTDPKGRPIYWLGPVGPPGFDAGPGTDFHALASGLISITPLQTDLTAYRLMDELGAWLPPTNN